MIILFVDDEERRMETYIEELKAEKYMVEFKSDVDDAMHYFQENKDKINLLVLDVMMPTGKSFNDNDTDFGMRTGIFLHKEIRKNNSSLPIVILTNVSDPEVKECIEHDSNSYFLQKEDYLPYELVEKITEILSQS
jgi:CheY-like chemotaxis protein